MTAENVSNEQLLNDIELTEKEMGAYDCLSQGYCILSGLPENAGLMRQKYLIEGEEYNMLLKKCCDFLEKLYAIKEERGL